MQVTYRKIRADFEDVEKGRFYRVFLVPENISLLGLGLIMKEMFHGASDSFLFSLEDGVELAPSSVMRNGDSNLYLWMKGHTLMDLYPCFRFIYDDLDEWGFDCRIYPNLVVKIFEHEFEAPLFVLLEGAGQGIWDGCIETLIAYCEGSLPPNIDHSDDNNGISFPWNVHIDRIGDYDLPLDIKKENDMFGLESFTIDKYVRADERYAKKHGIVEKTISEYKSQKVMERCKCDMATGIANYILSTNQLPPHAFRKSELELSGLETVIEQCISDADVEAIVVKTLEKIKHRRHRAR